MDCQERLMCRLCFKVCDSFKPIEGELNGILHMVLKEIDLTIIQEPIVCTCCAAMLIKCSEFKAKCLDAWDCILSFINNKDDDLKLNLKEVYLSMSKIGVDLSDAQKICGFCMSPVKSCSAICLDVKGEGIILQNMIEQCLPELDFSNVEEPVICAPCRDALESCFWFVKNCLIVEEKIKEFRETRDANGKGRVEPSGLLEFMTRDVAIKVEKQDADEEEIGNGCDKLGVEQIAFCDVTNNIKEEVDDNVMPKDMLNCEGDVKLETTFCEEGELKEKNADVEDQPVEDVFMKTEECDFNRSENDYLPFAEVTTKLQIKRQCLIRRKTNKNTSSKTVYRCDSCYFLTKNKGSFTTHSLKHKDPLEVTMYKCNECSFQTKLKKSLTRHMLTHKDPSEVTMYKCNSCSFQTRIRRNLTLHMLIHKDPSEVTMYKCDSCLFQTRHKKSLKEHLKKHKDPSEVPMYKCSLCSFQTIIKSSIRRHNMMIHKDPSEITMYKCDICLFQSKHKKSLKEHLMMKHQDPSEVPAYNCSLCSFQTKIKKSLTRHMITHMDPSEVTAYKCDICFFQTKHKNCLKEHFMKHRDPSEVITYKCSVCSLQMKSKRGLKRHTLRHF